MLFLVLGKIRISQNSHYLNIWLIISLMQFFFHFCNVLKNRSNEIHIRGESPVITMETGIFFLKRF